MITHRKKRTCGEIGAKSDSIRFEKGIRTWRRCRRSSRSTVTAEWAADRHRMELSATTCHLVAPHDLPDSGRFSATRPRARLRPWPRRWR
jgi:hypothetical protein